MREGTKVFVLREGIEPRVGLGLVQAVTIVKRAEDRYWRAAGHRVELLRYHTHVLAYMGNCQWKFSTVDEYEERMTQALSRANSLALDA